MPGLRPNRGAFLVIALILLIVLSALGVAIMSVALNSSRTSQNFGGYQEAKLKAQSMAEYAKNILDSYPDGVYPGPATCNSSVTCNVIDNNFPHNGRPVLVWTSGLSADPSEAAQTDAWWTTNGFAYEGAFAGDGDARVIVIRQGVSTDFPYTNTYKIIGYGTDSSGTARATYVLYASWNGYRPDGGGGTCASGCNYGQCCNSSTTCTTDQTGCEGGSATYVPPGWSCADYFVDGLGYDATTCNNVVARFTSMVNLVDGLVDQQIAYRNLYSGGFPNAYTLGLAGSYIDDYEQEVSTPTNPLPYVFRIVIGDNPVGCRGNGHVWLGADPSAMGFDAGTASGNGNVGFQCMIRGTDANGTPPLRKACVYWYGTAGTSQTTALLPGLANLNTTNAWDGNNWVTELNGIDYFPDPCDFSN